MNNLLIRLEMTDVESGDRYHFDIVTYHLFYSIFYDYVFRCDMQLLVPKNGIKLASKPDDFEPIASRKWSSVCGCGREYTDTDNGQPFMFVEPHTKRKMEGILEAFNSPVLCERCYYRAEMRTARRHLVPTRWQKVFANELG